MPQPAQQPAASAQYGLREDGTAKAEGWLGKLKNKDGRVSTELSVSYEIEGKEILMPSLVPGLTKKEIDHLLANKAPTKQIEKKIIDHAMQRIADGKSPFAGPGEGAVPATQTKGK